jgi:hypothetical protein
MYASAGQISEWYIGDKGIFSSSAANSTSNIFLSPTGVNVNGEKIVFKAGSNFRVDNTGAMYASAGKIGNWEIGTHYLSTEGKTNLNMLNDGIFISPNLGLAIGPYDAFKVSTSGKVWAKNIYLTAAESSSFRVLVARSYLSNY